MAKNRVVPGQGAIPQVKVNREPGLPQRPTFTPDPAFEALQRRKNSGTDPFAQAAARSEHIMERMMDSSKAQASMEVLPWAQYFDAKEHKAGKFVEKRDGDSGYDLWAREDIDNILVHPGQVVEIPTGIAVAVPRGLGFIVKERGSTGKLCMSTRAGVIDSNYRGEIIILVNNTGHRPFLLSRKENIPLQTSAKAEWYNLSKAVAQGLLVPTLHFKPVQMPTVESLGNTDRGEGRYGSTNTTGETL